MLTIWRHRSVPHVASITGTTVSPRWRRETVCRWPAVGNGGDEDDLAGCWVDPAPKGGPGLECGHPQGAVLEAQAALRGVGAAPMEEKHTGSFHTESGLIRGHGAASAPGGLLERGRARGMGGGRAGVGVISLRQRSGQRGNVGGKLLSGPEGVQKPRSVPGGRPGRAPRR